MLVGLRILRKLFRVLGSFFFLNGRLIRFGVSFCQFPGLMVLDLMALVSSRFKAGPVLDPYVRSFYCRVVGQFQVLRFLKKH